MCPCASVREPMRVLRKKLFFTPFVLVMACIAHCELGQWGMWVAFHSLASAVLRFFFRNFEFSYVVHCMDNCISTTISVASRREKRAKTTVLSRANAYIKSILLRLEYKIDLTKLLFMHSCLVRSIFFMAHKKVRLKWYQPPTLCTQFAMHAYFKNELFDDCTLKTVFLFVLLTNVTNWWVFKRLYQCPISKQFIAS